MLRHIPAAIALSFTLAPPAAASGKTPGAYVSLPVRDAAACARACADDGLCMAWSFNTSGACELTAILPLSSPEDAAAMGVSSRARDLNGAAPANNGGERRRAPRTYSVNRRAGNGCVPTGR